MSNSFDESRNEIPEGDAPQQRPVTVMRSVGRPWVTYTILAVTVLVYILQMMTQAGIFIQPFLALGRLVLGDSTMNVLLAQNRVGDILVLLGGKINSLIILGQVWRLLTPALLHASLVHIGFNMYALFVIGPSLEHYYGPWRYLGLYVLGAFGGNVLSFLLSSGISIGASTSIFALVAAEGVFIYQNRAMFGANARAMLTNVLVIVVINFFLGLSPGIDNWGHLGGMLAGLAFGWFAGPLMKVEGIYPLYNLVDQRSTSTAWMTGVSVAIVFAGLAALGFR